LDEGVKKSLAISQLLHDLLPSPADPAADELVESDESNLPPSHSDH
jgi:hypothetical protein